MTWERRWRLEAKTRHSRSALMHMLAPSKAGRVRFRLLTAANTEAT